MAALETIALNLVYGIIVSVVIALAGYVKDRNVERFEPIEAVKTVLIGIGAFVGAPAMLQQAGVSSGLSLTIASIATYIIDKLVQGLMSPNTK